jgi:four helix bundle protein
MQFLGIARGSHFELQTQLMIAKELSFGDAQQIATAEALSEEVGRMIFAIIRSLNESQQ